MKAMTRLLTTTTLLTVSGAAMAHPGHAEGGFMSGLLHPLLGTDHLLAMAAIGFWSLRQSPLLKNLTPLFVVAGMILGAALAWSGLHLPGVETGISLSVLLAGILIAAMVRLPAAVGGTLVAVFMLFHGHAHGTEMPEGATLVAYMTGFTLATLAITLAGRALGSLMQKTDHRFGRALGAAIAATGAVLAAG